MRCHVWSVMIESLSSSAAGGGITSHLGHYAFILDHPQQLKIQKLRKMTKKHSTLDF